MEYQILSSQQEEVLARNVETLSRSGWRPQGGVTVYERHGSVNYAQALMKG